jgi:enamine deaminase RidA (YjgF/YER057c/UK114 family)
MANWEPVGRAHREAFGDAWPASTLVQVAMASPEMLVEIEADAVIGG